MATIGIMGDDGRAHALAHMFDRFGHRSVVFPGNAGMQRFLPEKDSYVPALLSPECIAWGKKQDFDLVIPSAEHHLAEGLVDSWRVGGHRVYGPTRAVFNELEGSKARTHMTCAAIHVPRPKTVICTGFYEAYKIAKEVFGAKVVIKADGLARGKGAIRCDSMNEVNWALKKLLTDDVPVAKNGTIVLEEFLEGGREAEFSMEALTGGVKFVPLPAVRDSKLFKGKMTGGMGAWGPVALFEEKEHDLFIGKTLRHLQAIGTPYQGNLFAGIMGNKLLEYNNRGGSPETQVWSRLIDSDPYPLYKSAADGCAEGNLKIKKGFVVSVVLAAEGYPDKVIPGAKITGLEEAKKVLGVEIFYSNASHNWLENSWFVSGGRVVDVTAYGTTLEEARERAYRAVSMIHFDGMQYDETIGLS